MNLTFGVRSAVSFQNMRWAPNFRGNCGSAPGWVSQSCRYW